MHILSPRWLVPGLRYQWNGVENLRHFAKILSKFSRDCDNFQAPFYTRTSLNYIKICFSPSSCGNASFKIMHIVVKIWDWANSILQFKIKLERLWNKRALEFVSKQRLSFSVDSQFSQSWCAIVNHGSNKGTKFIINLLEWRQNGISCCGINCHCMFSYWMFDTVWPPLQTSPESKTCLPKTTTLCKFFHYKLIFKMSFDCCIV